MKQCWCAGMFLYRHEGIPDDNHQSRCAFRSYFSQNMSVMGMQVRYSHQSHFTGQMQKRTTRVERRPKNTSRKTQICRRFRYMLERPKLRAEAPLIKKSWCLQKMFQDLPSAYLMYGRKVKERKNPDTKPQMCAKLSIQGSRPKEKKNVEMATNLAKALHGRSRICQL